MLTWRLLNIMLRLVCIQVRKNVTCWSTTERASNRLTLILYAFGKAIITKTSLIVYLFLSSTHREAIPAQSTDILSNHRIALLPQVQGSHRLATVSLWSSLYFTKEQTLAFSMFFKDGSDKASLQTTLALEDNLQSQVWSSLQIGLKLTCYFLYGSGGTSLNEDLKLLAHTNIRQDFVDLEIQFPDGYPEDPFFLRVVSPRMVIYTGQFCDRVLEVCG